MSEVRTVDRAGCRLAYRLEGAGPPVLFVQGVNTHGGGWRPQVEALRGRYACLTFDHRGLGDSGRGAGPVSVEQMADDAAAVMAAAGWATAHVVGHSLGGPVALQLALAARPRVRSLAVLCGFARGRDVGPLSWRLAWAGVRMKLGTRRARRRAFLELVTVPAERADPDALAARLAPLFGHDLADPPAVLADQMRAVRACDLSGRLGELAGVPTVAASAALDPITPPALGRAVAAGVPGARYVVWAGASHAVPLTQPGRVNDLLLEHLAAAEKGTGR